MNPLFKFNRLSLLGISGILLSLLVVKPSISLASESLNSSKEISRGDLRFLNAPEALPTISISDSTVSEGNADTVNAVFTVSLSAAYTDTITVDFSTQNGTATAPEDFIASSGRITFTTGIDTQELTFTIQGDFIDETDESFSVTLTNPTNTTIANGVGTGTITDNDSAGITVTPTSGLTTTESAGTANFTIVLNSQPTQNVTINVNSTNITEGTVAPASLTFTSENWGTAQSVTVTGVNDDEDDGDIVYTARTTTSSSDPNYSVINPADVSVTNIDNDTAGVSVSPTSGLITTEAGSTAEFTIVLESQPTANVTINLVSSDTSEGTVVPASFTFSAANWNTAQGATITGVNDNVDDGDIAYAIQTTINTADQLYQTIIPADVSVTNIDNETAGISVTPTSGLVTAEGGTQSSFTVVLDSEPLANVSISVNSNDTSEGTVSPSSLVFTPTNWNAPQTVTITGVDDAAVDGNVVYNIITGAAQSTDSGYNNLAVADVSVTNTDNDSAEVTVTPTSGLVTSEGGGTANFEVVLTSQPSAPVNISLLSTNSAEGTVNPTTLIFTTSNWSSPQSATITGVDDQVDDGNIPYTIQTTGSSADPLYNAINPADVSVTNTDDDTAAIIVNPLSGLTTTEGGGTATFTVVLQSQPTTLVYIYSETSDNSEGVASPTPISFNTVNWNVPRTITVTGIDDASVDGNIPYTIQVTASSVDLLYNAIDPNDVLVTNTDDDIAGITVNPVSGLTTTEAGTSANFTVRLNSQPTSNVIIGISSSDVTEGTAAPSSLTFTSANWNSLQTVTISGVDDPLIDGDISYLIQTAAAVSSDLTYNGMNAEDVSVTNADNDAAGIVVNPVSGLITAETGTTATFTIVLTSQPTADVTIPLSSSDTTEGTIMPTSVVFAPSTWNSPQTVTITGVDDPIVDGSQVYTISTAAATSLDANFAGQNASDVSVTNNDNDVASVAITPVTGLLTSESGGSDSFSVVLTSQPSASVIVYFDSSDVSEGTVSPALLTFTSGNWNVTQSVTITGVDDAIVDGSQSYIIGANSSSSDTNYDAISITDVSVTNADNDSAGIIVDPISGLITSEAGQSGTFSVVLSSQPSANVNIALSSSDSSEGSTSVSQLTFTSFNWNIQQVVTVSGIDDYLDDGDISYTLITEPALSADPYFSGVNPADVLAVNLDNDTAGLTVNPTSGLITSETGVSADFDIVLNSQPTENVTIALSSSDLTEGTVAPASLTFTPANWNTAQIATVTGVNDFVVDGNIAYTIITGAASSLDPNYNNRVVPDVSVTNSDNDTAGIIINPTTGLFTTEAGGTANFSVVLNSQPVASVVVLFDSQDLSEGIISQNQLTFTTSNWNTQQNITVTGVDDYVMDGPQNFSIATSVSSADPLYGAINPADVAITNSDDDSAGITVTPTTGLSTTESGGTANFTVVLDSQPTANVTIGISSSDTSEGLVSPGSLIFTPANWNFAQSVTVTGVDDAVADSDVSYTIYTAAAVSSDGNYSGLDPLDVSVTNSDDDAVGITVNPISGLNTTEAGGSATFTVVLKSQPTSSVTIELSSSDLSEGSVSLGSVVFTSANWNNPQIVTVIGVDDYLMDGPQSYTIVTDLAISTDTNFSGQNAPDVSVTNADNDNAGVTIDPVVGLTTTESGGTDTFSVVLDSEPVASVIVYLNSTDTGEGTVTPAFLTFNPSAWNTPQLGTITGADDIFIDGPQAYTIRTTVSSADPDYNAVNPEDVSVTNLDNDSAGIFVDPVSGLSTTEAGGSDSFSVVLSSQPTSNVTIGLSSSDLSEGTVLPVSLVFTTLNWNVPQNATVMGVDDALDDGDVTYDIITEPAVSLDTNFSGQNPPNVSVTNSDDDAAGISVNPLGGLQTSEAGGDDTFSVVLVSQPTANVNIPLSSSDISEGTVSPSLLTFTSGNWSIPQTVTVTGVDDELDDGNIAFTVVTAAAVSVDANFSGKNPPDVSVTNTDDDTTPVAVVDSYITNATPTNPLMISAPGVLGNDTDVDGDSLLALLESNPANGTLSLSSSGAFTYTPNPLFNGIDNFYYKASDGANLSNSARVEITVDRIAPTVEWVSPVGEGQILYVTDETLLLLVNASDNLSLSRIRFARWDFVNQVRVELGEVTTAPYQVTLDTTTLYYGANQIDVFAYDTAGNFTWKIIWLFREAKIFLPLIAR